ncbi:MAG: hypothetical protein KJ811_01250, partial [Candidatus Margulisbacteria bacterium]|nr:hypothetical protein [Candidatus Margulisiibacteriota bacterium]
PMVAIFTSKAAKPTRWGPWKTEHVVVRKKSKCPHFCDASHCPFDLCRYEITSDDIVAGLEKLLNGQGNKTYQAAFADWCKKTFSITLASFSNDLASARQHLNLLINNGYMVSLITKHDSPLIKEYQDKTMVYPLKKKPSIFSSKPILDIFVKENTNILHPLDNFNNFNFKLIALLSAAKMQIPVVMVKSKEISKTSSDLIAQYVKACRSTGI